MLSHLADKITYFNVIRTCWRYCDRVEQRRMLLINALLIIANVVGATKPLIIGAIVTVVAKGGPGFHHNLLLWLGLLVINHLAYWAVMGPARIQERRLAVALRKSLTERLYDEVMSLPWAWHQGHHTGDTLSRVNTSTKALFAFADNQFQYVNTFAGLISAVIMLLIIAPIVGIFWICIAPPLFYAIRKFDALAMRLKAEQNLRENILSTGLVDHFGNVITLIVLRLVAASKRDLTERFAKLATVGNNEMLNAIYKWAFFTTATTVITAVALLFYLYLQSNVSMAIAAGTLVTIFQYLQQIDGALQNYGWSYELLLQHRIDLSAIDSIRQSAREVIPLTASPYAAKWKKAELSHINFRYEDREHHIHQLSDVTISLARGRRIALVGSSGSGKSTLLRLLRGLHEPESGSLYIDEASQPDLAVLAAVSTLIPQDAEIFENTLRYNIAFGAEGDLQDVIDMACLGPVIDPLPEKLDTDIRERGINLSGGQKQRLALARGLFAARDSSLLLLDEPTSSLDPITEAEVFANILSAMPNTCIVAAIHRLHLLDRFDHIYVMAHGRIIEQGTLAELLALDGTLAELWAAQKKENFMAQAHRQN